MVTVEYCEACSHHAIKEEKYGVIYHACCHPSLPHDRVIPVEDFDEGLIPEFCPLPEDVNINPKYTIMGVGDFKPEQLIPSKYIFDPAKIVEQIERRITDART